jgi:hypothetical protein
MLSRGLVDDDDLQAAKTGARLRSAVACHGGELTLIKTPGLALI